MKSKNSKTSKLHVLVLKLTDDLRRSKKVLLYQILVFTVYGRIFKNHITTILNISPNMK